MFELEHSINAISPLDGRYSSKLDKKIKQINSERGLIKQRVYIEVSWFIFLFKINSIKSKYTINNSEKKYLLDIVEKFNVDDARLIKSIEDETNHDVKAVEFFLRKKFSTHPTLKDKKELIHLCLTSEDINNVAYALNYNETRELLLGQLNSLLDTLKSLIKETSSIGMVSKTHGQNASPTTMGKELSVFYKRVERKINQIKDQEVYAKFSGAVGNYNSHIVVDSRVDWERETNKFIKSLGLKQNKYTTQIEPHDWMCESLNTISHTSNILLDLSKDMWTYIMLEYFSLKKINNEVGSSTMPHKINPIDFENAEGNLEMCHGISTTISRKLSSSRLQRDLSDSTVMRNIGLVYGYLYISINSLISGLNKIQINEKKIKSDLDDCWELLAEPIQTVMRLYNINDSYNIIKKSTRGKLVNKQTIHKIIKKSSLPANIKSKLLKLKPSEYLGIAKELSNKVDK
tara:strand:+ start:1781 stop:3160 length:1380 start_codon:yes stop_codon:yes gene_type:complete